MLYHVNGELVPADEATVNVRDRGFMYGDAAFETLRAYSGELFAWNAHIDRLCHSCGVLGMPGIIPDDLRERVHETLDANGLADAYIRVSISRGVQPGKLTPRKDVNPSVIVIVKPLPRGGVGGDSVWDDAAVVRMAETRRIPTNAVPNSIKTHNYLNGILARLELREANENPRPDEALMQDTNGYVAEGATSNVFFVENGILKTPNEGPILPGVTRDIVLDLARDEAVPIEKGRYTVADIQTADEAFLTNTTWELRPIETISDVQIGNGPTTRLLTSLFNEFVQSNHY